MSVLSVSVGILLFLVECLYPMRNFEDIARLPAMERDILHLHLTLRKSQTEVAKILGVSQPTVNYRYKRARERLGFMEKVPGVSSEEIRLVLRSLGARDTDVEAMVLYVETSSQSEVARQMRTSQGAVRHWILRVLNLLQKDMREEDLHRRVRTACQMLVDRPGIYNEPIKQIADKKPQRKVRLATMPKVQGRFLVGEFMWILDGIYAKLEGKISALGDQTMEVQIEFESQQLVLSWPI